MKNIKKASTLLASISLVLITMVVAFSYTSNNLMNFVNADDVTYGITLNSSKNRFHDNSSTEASDGRATVKTNLGNSIDFTYYQLKSGGNDVWQILDDDAYFYNNDPIHGIESLTLSCNSNNEFQILYSSDSSFDKALTYTSSNLAPTVIDFNNYRPNYFKILNTSNSDFSIESIVITLNCSNSYPKVSLSVNDGSMGTVSGDGIKNAGSTVTISATANTGYKFIGWYSGETLISTDASYTFTIGHEDVSYAARFTYESYNLIVQSESSIKGNVSNSSGSYNYLTPIRIEATANEGYAFEGWYDDSTLISTNNPYSFTMPHADTTYTAKFSANAYKVTLNNDDEELGSISGSGTYFYDNSVTITATPNAGVSFLGWYDNDDELVSTLKTYTFNMPSKDLEYTAKFEQTKYSLSLTVNDETRGSATGEGSYIYNQEVTLEATPVEHNSFFGWFIDDKLISQELTYSFNMPASSLNITAKFVKNYKLNISSDDETKGSVSGPSEYGAGLEVSVVANANTDYALDYWRDADNNEKSTEPTYTFTMPENDYTLVAHFDKGYTLTLESENIEKGTVSGGGQYKAGRSVTIALNQISGKFLGWYGDRAWYTVGTWLSESSSYTFTMPEKNYTIKAVFMTDDKEAEWKKTHGITPVIDEANNTVTYGLYPQTIVNDGELISHLNELTTTEPNGWYKYRWEYYAKVSATPYGGDYKFSDGATIVSGTTYWFKCEPITWRILTTNYIDADGNNTGYYLLSNVLLDTHRFAASYSNYANSDIRAWLNDEFYGAAFALNDEYISTTVVDNGASTKYDDRSGYACENTADKIFLPSYKDYVNKDYGFNSNKDNEDSLRKCDATDYTKAIGACLNSSSFGYYTRSPDYDGTITNININGEIKFSRPSNTYFSLRPSLSLKISN